MANNLVKLSEIETWLAQQEAGIRVKNAENKTLLAEQMACKALRDERSWTSTILTTMNTGSKKKDKKLAGIRRAVAKKEVELVVAKKQAFQHDNCAGQIEAVACRRQEDVAWLTDDIYSLRDALESVRERREKSNRQAWEIRDLQQKEMLALQKK